MRELDDLGELIAAVIDATEAAEQGIYTQALNDVVGFLQKLETEMYDRQQDPTGVPWAPLAPSTIKAKGHDTILFRTGAMRESLTAPAGTADTVWMTGDNWVTFGTSVEYAHWHMTGTQNEDKSVRMPARPHVGVNDQVVSQIGQRLASAVADKFREGLKNG